MVVRLRVRRPRIVTALAAAVLVALIAGCVPGRVRHAARSLGDPATRSTHDEARPPTAPVERALILDLVRAHRRRADDATRRRLTDALWHESRRAGVDPLMVAAIVAHESSFANRAVSRAGAVGLMQLRPFVARDVARRRGIEWAGHQALREPELNVRLGILYYQELLDRFDGDAELALAAYNAGPTRVRRMVRNGDYRGSSYARRVLATYEALARMRDETVAGVSG